MASAESNRRVADACDQLRALGYGTLAHAAWIWWRNTADQNYINNVLDIERDVALIYQTRADLKELRMRIEEADALATKKPTDDGEWIAGYHFNTGAWHRLLAEARK
jgi:hypothetical protein